MGTPWTSHVVFVIGGGEDARVDALQAVRMGWDLIAFKGTGGLAGQLVACMEKRADSGVATLTNDLVIDEIVTEGHIAIVDLARHTVDDVTSLVYSRLLQGRTTSGGSPGVRGSSASGSTSVVSSGDSDSRILRQAWTTCAEYSLTAQALRRRFATFEAILMSMALWTTLIVALDSDLRYNSNHWSASTRQQYVDSASQAVRVFIGLLPILISVVLAVKSRFQYVAKYAALQEQAAAIVRETYHYRTNTLDYRDSTVRESRLAARLKQIAANLLMSPAAETAVESCGTKDVIAIVDERDARGRRTKRAQRFRAVLDLDDNDNGVDDISVDEYTRLRMSRELDRYRDKARSLHRAIKFLEFAGYFLLSLCTALILVDEEVWVAVCIVLVNATANMAAVGMLEDKLARTNGAIVKVDRLSSWWRTLEEGAKSKHAYANRCVSAMEAVVTTVTIGALPQVGGGVGDSRNGSGKK